MAPKFPMPVGGEAGAWVKGKFGNMRSFRKRRFKRRFDNNVWVPYFGANGINGVQGFLPEDMSAKNVVAIPAGFGLGQASSAGAVSDETPEAILAASNIIRIQGGIYLTATPPASEDIPAANAPYPQTLDCWYFWQRQELTPAGYGVGAIESPVNFNPHPYIGAAETGYLGNILRQKNILRWGCVRLAVPDLFAPTAAPTGEHRGHAPLMNRGFIPAPRISPKYGMKLRRREFLSCYVAVTPGDIVVTDYEGVNITPVMFMPALRICLGLN